MKPIRRLALVLAGLTLACTLTPTDSGGGEDTATRPPTEATATDTPAPEPTAEPVILAQEVCLPAGQSEVQYLSEAGGYCFLLPDSFSVTQQIGLDIFAVGPTLETFGMDRLALIAEFNVIGAPGGAGERDARNWGEAIAAEYGAPGIEISIEPYVFGEVSLEGVRVGPLPGLVGSEVVVIRTNDTLYSVTVHPDRESYPEYVEDIEQLWGQLERSTRFFTPVDTGIEYRTESEVCPTEQEDTEFVINLGEGWCALIPADWQEDEAFDFPGRFFGGPDIGDFWPGQPPHANIVIGAGGPVGDITLEQRVEGRRFANGQPELVQRTDTVIGGFPAVILDAQDGPHPTRVAMIDANGFQFSVLGQPFDAARFPEAQAELEAAWELVIGSVQFFEPYR